MLVGPVGAELNTDPSNDSSVTAGGSSFQSSAFICTRNGFRPSTSKATSRTGKVRENTRHFRTESSSSVRCAVSSLKRASAAALFIAAATLRRTVVDNHGAGKMVINVAVVGIDYLPVHTSDPASRVDDFQFFDSLGKLHAHGLVCGDPVRALSGIPAARRDDGYFDMRIGVPSLFVSHFVFPFLVPVSCSGDDLYLDSTPRSTILFNT